jgi:sec-independent protein translocase protein TatB
VFDINGGEFLVILLVAVIVIGPSRLPRYAEELGRIVRRARAYLQDARERVGDELGEDVKDIDWEALDPRRYDPRRIVRDALLDPDPDASGTGPAVRTPAGAPPQAVRPTYRTSAAAATAAAAGTTDPSPPPAAPFDDEAT